MHFNNRPSTRYPHIPIFPFNHLLQCCRPAVYHELLWFQGQLAKLIGLRYGIGDYCKDHFCYGGNLRRAKTYFLLSSSPLLLTTPSPLPIPHITPQHPPPPPPLLFSLFSLPFPSLLLLSPPFLSPTAPLPIGLAHPRCTPISGSGPGPHCQQHLCLHLSLIHGSTFDALLVCAPSPGFSVPQVQQYQPMVEVVA